MKSKTTLSLIEQIIMVFVFSVAAAICLKIFVYSDNLSKDNAVRDIAVFEARNVAETLKGSHGNFDTAYESFNSHDNLSLVIEPIDTASRYLGKARIHISGIGGEIFALEVSWQEELT